jgi:hypothetical protein
VAEALDSRHMIQCTSLTPSSRCGILYKCYALYLKDAHHLFGRLLCWLTARADL